MVCLLEESLNFVLRPVLSQQIVIALTFHQRLHILEVLVGEPGLDVIDERPTVQAAQSTISGFLAFSQIDSDPQAGGNDRGRDWAESTSSS